MDPLSLIAAAQSPSLAARPLVITARQSFSYAEIAERASRFAQSLLDEGIDPRVRRARIALQAKNSVETIIAIYALIELGVSIIPIHPRLLPTEVKVILDDAAPVRVLSEHEIRHRIERATRPLEQPSAPHDPESPLAIVYTSGTTGKPKGALLSRRAFLASAHASAENLPLAPGDSWLLCLPVCHVGGLSILTRTLVGKSTILLEPRFDPEAVLDAIEHHSATYLSVVPTMLKALLERDSSGRLALLRAVLVGGAAAPTTLLEACARARVPAITTYGLTEACSQVTVQRLDATHRPEPGSGAPLSGVELHIHEGRILVRSPTLMSGYFRGQDSAPDTSAFDEDGWFDTGDLGEIDEHGRLHVHSRRTDLIVTGGENVYPLEIEHILETLPGVRRALVFGVPDEHWGQIVAAALELERETELQAIADACAELLSPHKRPRKLARVAELPLLGSGKLDRKDAFGRFAELLVPLSPR